MSFSSNTVIVVEDEDSIRDAIQLLLETQGYAVHPFRSAEELLAVAGPLPRGCMLVDLRLPGMDGLALQQELKNREVRHPVIFMTGFANIATAVEAMRNGAFDFIEKPVEGDVLIERVRQALAVEVGEHQAHATKEELLLRMGRISKRELQVFDRVVDGMTNKAIASDLSISERTVEVHRAQVMNKMGATTLAELIKMRLRLED